jgi:hypothetical protein
MHKNIQKCYLTLSLIKIDGYLLALDKIINVNARYKLQLSVNRYVFRALWISRQYQINFKSISRKQRIYLVYQYIYRMSF